MSVYNELQKQDKDLHDFESVKHANGIFDKNEIQLFEKRYRFGLINPYDQLTSCREYLFFTKPDLNIFPRDDTTGIPSNLLDHYLSTQPYWLGLEKTHPKVLQMLQSSLNRKNVFNDLLGNMVQSNLEVPAISSEMIDTPNNSFGVGYTYHGSSEASDDSFDFSLEFKDTKSLPVYHFFKAYENYQTIKHHGHLQPWIKYIRDKVLYDQYSIYKFLVDMDDGETILYYAKYYGVKSKSLPRDVFSDTNFDNGLSYSIEFNAAFFEDMDPSILSDFNNLYKGYYNSMKYILNPYDENHDRADNRAAKAANVFSYNTKNGDLKYKLVWKGDDKY